MKTGTRQFTSTLIIIAFVVALSGIFAGYVYAQKGLTECPTRWGEPIGVGCRMPSEITTVATKALLTTVGEEVLTECPTRWGEPIGIGCRISVKVTAIAVKEIPTAEEVYTKCPTRWGEPIGIGCR